MSIPVQEITKHVADVSAGASVTFAWMATLTPFVELVIIVLAAIYGVYRIWDLMLSVKIKRARLKKELEK